MTGGPSLTNLQLLARTAFSSPPRAGRARVGAERGRSVDSLDTLVLARADTLALGRYRLLERLGAGGFGVVWRAHDERLQREVALKRIFLPTQDDDSIAERAEREAQATARLSHPAIVALYEARSEGEAFYLISELVHGETLATLIAEDTLRDEEVLAIGVALAGALEHAHARGVIHRDVKPQNILIPHDCTEHAGAVAKLTDFGGARVAGEDVLTRTGDVLGTLAYMAPEQSEGREASAQADLYSLALVLYEALCGVNPVRGATPAATARRIGSVLAPLERRRGDLPRELTRALDLALAPNPSRRGTLVELREALEEGLEERPPAPRRIVAAHRRDPTLIGPRLPRERTREPQLDRALAARTPPRHSPDGAPRSDGSAQDESLPAHRLRIPRAVWAGAALALAIWQAALGRPGVSLLILAAALPLLIAPRLHPQALGAAVAPGLGAVGLAGMYPALAGQFARWPARAGLGALGYWWLCLAEPLSGRRLWLGLPGGGGSQPVARPAWEGSLSGAFEHVMVPTLSLGVLAGVALWAGGAVLLPWLVRGRNAALDVLASTVWTAAMLAALPLLDRGLPGAAAHAAPRGALLGALLGGGLAVVARALRGPV
jgi:eukaryotic-like serine/threonine-protein kinase